jgi:Zn-finger in Ran binding protein and others
MPASWKCSQCGLVNFAYDQSCKRCGALGQGSEMQPTPAPAGIVLEDGYVMPPPPATGGIWRERSTLVMTKDATLPDHCVKCDAPANGFRLQKKLSWHHPALFLLLLLATILYLVLAMIFRKQATVYFGLCQEHYRRRQKLLAAGWVMFGIGLIAPVVGFSTDYPGIALLGILLLFISIIWLAIVARIVTVKKIDDQFVWLTGLNENYLARFPALPE